MHCTTRAPMAASVRFFALVSLIASISTGCVDVVGSPERQPTPQSAFAAPASVANGSDIVGYWDGVGFSADEAKAVLAFVNHATLEQLDADVGLDLRAARSIVEAQPIANMATLSGLFFVGEVTLTLIKQAATSPNAPMAVVQFGA